MKLKSGHLELRYSVYHCLSKSFPVMAQIHAPWPLILYYRPVKVFPDGVCSEQICSIVTVDVFIQGSW